MVSIGAYCEQTWGLIFQQLEYKAGMGWTSSAGEGQTPSGTTEQRKTMFGVWPRDRQELHELVNAMFANPVGSSLDALGVNGARNAPDSGLKAIALNGPQR